MKVKRRKVPVEQLESYPGNARVHDLEAIKESLRAHGQYRSVVVQASTQRVIAGNGVLAAARELGIESLVVDEVDVDDEQARRIVLVDNRTNDLGGYDEQALAELLRDLDDLEGTGFDADDVEGFMKLIQEPVELPEYPDSMDDRKGVRSQVECPNCGHVFQP